jgi:hypothetical protein
MGSTEKTETRNADDHCRGAHRTYPETRSLGRTALLTELLPKTKARQRLVRLLLLDTEQEKQIA